MGEIRLAELMGLEPTTFAVTGRCSNQLRYNSSTGATWGKGNWRS